MVHYYEERDGGFAILVREMAEKDDWEEFAASGRVMDYLEYKGCIDRVTNLSDTVTGPDTAGNVLFVEENDRRKKEEEVTDAEDSPA